MWGLWIILCQSLNQGTNRHAAHATGWLATHSTIEAKVLKLEWKTMRQLSSHPDAGLQIQHTLELSGLS